MLLVASNISNDNEIIAIRKISYNINNILNHYLKYLYDMYNRNN